MGECAWKPEGVPLLVCPARGGLPPAWLQGGTMAAEVGDVRLHYPESPGP